MCFDQSKYHFKWYPWFPYSLSMVLCAFDFINHGSHVVSLSVYRVKCVLTFENHGSHVVCLWLSVLLTRVDSIINHGSHLVYVWLSYKQWFPCSLSMIKCDVDQSKNHNKPWFTCSLSMVKCAKRNKHQYKPWFPCSLSMVLCAVD